MSSWWWAPVSSQCCASIFKSLVVFWWGSLESQNAFPDCKVILSVRDEDSWLKSARSASRARGFIFSRSSPRTWIAFRALLDSTPVQVYYSLPTGKCQSLEISYRPVLEISRSARQMKQEIQRGFMAICFVLVIVVASCFVIFRIGKTLTLNVYGIYHECTIST